jgi:hypothetical protein
LSRESESPPSSKEYAELQPAGEAGEEVKGAPPAGLGFSSDGELVGQARVDVEDKEVTPISRNVSALDLTQADRELEKATGVASVHDSARLRQQGKIEWEGMTRDALSAEAGINQDHTKTASTSLVTPVLLVSPESGSSESTGGGVVSGMRATDSHLAPPSASSEPTRSTLDAEDSSSCPTRQAQYEAEQRRFRASSVGVEGPLGPPDAESSSSSSEDAGSVTEEDLTGSTETETPSGDQADSNTPDYTGSLIALGNPVSS